jgi:pyruvate/2-oxoglutarate dehydrogenase complex dihydrolipoamide dehydrogenase (E3) component
MVRRAGDFGIDVPEFTIDFSRVMERQNAIRNGASEGLRTYLEEATDFYEGTAVFLSDREVRVGGSYIGLEFSQASRRFGSKVTVLERAPRVMPREDIDSAEEARSILNDEGIEILCDTQVTATHRGTAGGVAVSFQHNGSEQWKASDRIMIYSMFIDPPLARVGMNEAQARESGRKVLTAKMPMSRINRAREKDETRGLVKFFVDADSTEILGGTILGVGGDEIINGIAAWMYTGLPYTDFQRAVTVHPTVAELMPWIFENLEPLD